MISPDLVEALTPVVDALEKLRVPYHIGGSVASSILGMGRSTVDVDIVANLKLEQVDAFVELLGQDYYASPEMIRDAVKRRSSFNLIHDRLMYKIDVFVPKESLLDRSELKRIRKEALEDTPGARLFNVSSPEDIVLRKLDWFRTGGGVSERQWLDTVGVLKVQANALDYDYLWEWACKLGLASLFHRALVDAGL